MKIEKWNAEKYESLSDYKDREKMRKEYAEEIKNLVLTMNEIDEVHFADIAINKQDLAYFQVSVHIVFKDLRELGYTHFTELLKTVRERIIQKTGINGFVGQQYDF